MTRRTRPLPPGPLPTDLIDGWTDLRAVLFFKDESCTDIRPIGIGEAIRREARTDALEP